MKLVLGDKKYQQSMLELLRLSIGEARLIKRQTGMTLTDWRFGFATIVEREDPDILASLVFLFRSRAGETVDWKDIDATGVQDFIAGFQFENSDRELIAKFLPSDVNWMDLVSPDEVDSGAQVKVTVPDESVRPPEVDKSDSSEVS